MKLPSRVSYEAKRVGNILTENVDIINRLCKEVEGLMHLLQWLTSAGKGAEPFCPFWVTAAVGHELLTHTRQTFHHKQHSDKVFSNVRVCVCVFGQHWSKSVVVVEEEVLLSRGWDVVVVMVVGGLQPQIMMWFQHEAGRVYLATVHYDGRPPSRRRGQSEGEPVISIFLGLKYEPLYSAPRRGDVKNNNSDPN